MHKNATQLSISQVARVVEMSVQNLRKTYINKGKLSVSKDARWMPYVDLSECLRVFPDRFNSAGWEKQVSNQIEPIGSNWVAESFRELLEKNRAMETDLQITRERLQNEISRREDAEKREAWLRAHVDQLTDENMKLLPTPKIEKKGVFARIFGK